MFSNLPIKNLVTGPVIKSKVLSLIPGSYMPEGEKQLQQVDLWPPHMCHPPHIHTNNFKDFNYKFFLYFMWVLVSELLKFEVLHIFFLDHLFLIFLISKFLIFPWSFLLCSAFFILLFLPGFCHTEAFLLYAFLHIFKAFVLWSFGYFPIEYLTRLLVFHSAF